MSQELSGWFKIITRENQLAELQWQGGMLYLHLNDVIINDLLNNFK